MDKLTYEQFSKKVIKDWQNKEVKELPSVIQRFLDNMYRNYCKSFDEKRYSINGEIFTAAEYGEYLIKKQYKESIGITQDPDELISKTETLEGIGLNFINSRMQIGDNRVYEVDKNGNKV